MNDKVEAGIALLEKQGHSVKPHNPEGIFWFAVNGRLLVSRQEMIKLADGVYTLEELENLYRSDATKNGKDGPAQGKTLSFLHTASSNFHNQGQGAFFVDLPITRGLLAAIVSFRVGAFARLFRERRTPISFSCQV
jgi:hypothetical protein